MNESEQSKELERIWEALERYYYSHNGDVFINVQLGAFNDKDDVIDDVVYLYGDRDVLRKSQENVSMILDAEENRFVDYFFE